MTADTEYPHLPWWDQNEDTLTQLVSKACACRHLNVTNHQKQRCMVFHVISSNSAEGTFPLSTSAQMAFDILVRGTATAPGHARRTAVAQLDDHLTAASFLSTCANRPLTTDTIVQAHSMLMQHALGDDGNPLRQGIRTGPVSSDMREFMGFDGIPGALDAAVARYNASPIPDFQSAVRTSAHLFTDIVHLIHPFWDGNGRLGCMLVAMSMQRHIGVFLPLVNGHGKVKKKHDAVVLRMLRRIDDQAGPMRSHIMECAAHRYCCLETCAESAMLALRGS